MGSKCYVINIETIETFDHPKVSISAHLPGQPHPVYLATFNQGTALDAVLIPVFAALNSLPPCPEPV